MTADESNQRRLLAVRKRFATQIREIVVAMNLARETEEDIDAAVIALIVNMQRDIFNEFMR